MTSLQRMQDLVFVSLCPLTPSFLAGFKGDGAFVSDKGKKCTVRRACGQGRSIEGGPVHSAMFMARLQEKSLVDHEHGVLIIRDPEESTLLFVERSKHTRLAHVNESRRADAFQGKLH